MEEEIDAIKRMLETMQGIYAGTTNPNVHRALIVGAHKGLGQLASAIHECLPIVTADSKGRFSGAQEHGDVHVGRVSDWFAKTIELKSKTDVSSTNVDKELRKGLTQLQGLQEKAPKPPRLGDIWVLDLLIANPRNPWPFPGKDQFRMRRRAAAVVERTKRKVDEVVKSAGAEPLKDYLADGWRPVGRHWGIDDPRLASVITPYRERRSGRGTNTSRPVFVLFDRGSGEILQESFMPALTIKIRYAEGQEYPIVQEGEGNGIREMKFQLWGDPETPFLDHIKTTYIGVRE